jgi:hypothetical protein
MRSVVVGQVEMRDAEVEGGQQHPPAMLMEVAFVGDGLGIRTRIIEVMPAADADRGQEQASTTAAVEEHRIVALRGAGVCMEMNLQMWMAGVQR